MKYVNWFFLAIFIFVASSCATNQLEKNYSLSKSKDNNETVFVMGVKSKNIDIDTDRYRFLIWPSDVESDSYRVLDTWKSAAYADTPQNDYIVGSVRGNAYIAFKHIILRAKNNLSTLAVKRLCNGQKGPVFYLPRRRVVYLGDINLRQEGEEIKYEITRNLKKAQLYMNRNYPNIKNELENVKMKTLNASSPCIPYGLMMM